MTITAPAIPDIAWFRDPGFTELTPLTVTPDGRVLGHLAGWSTPHRSFPGRNITAPRSRSNYRHFRTGSVQVRDGDDVVEVSAGNLTIGPGHADTHLSAAETSMYYDSACQIVAQVGIGEDAFGVWVAGALMPDVDDITLRRFRACSLSGDWRACDGHLDLVAALAVPVPGFPVPRSRVASGAPLALVAAGALAPPALFGRQVDPAWQPQPLKADAGGGGVGNGSSGGGGLTDEQAALLDAIDDTPALVAALLDEVDETPERVAALLAELDDEGIPTDLGELTADDVEALGRLDRSPKKSFGRLEKVPGEQNWIDRLSAGMKAAWHKSIIYRAAVHMHEERGMSVGHAIASAINWCRAIAATGDVKQWKGPQSVNPKSRAECVAALALWESMKAAAKAD